MVLTQAFGGDARTVLIGSQRVKKGAQTFEVCAKPSRWNSTAEVI